MKSVAIKLQSLLVSFGGGGLVWQVVATALYMYNDIVRVKLVLYVMIKIINV